MTSAAGGVHRNGAHARFASPGGGGGKGHGVVRDRQRLNQEICRCGRVGRIGLIADIEGVACLLYTSLFSNGLVDFKPFCL